MEYISKNEDNRSLGGFFNLDEVRNKSVFIGNGFNFDMNLIEIANYLRVNLGRPISINSAYRSQEHNDTLIGSVKNSQHIYGRALDLSGDGLVDLVKEMINEPRSVDVFKQMGLRGIGVYDNFVHIDTRQQNHISCWGNISKKARHLLKRWN